MTATATMSLFGSYRPSAHGGRTRRPVKEDAKGALKGEAFALDTPAHSSSSEGWVARFGRSRFGQKTASVALAVSVLGGSALFVITDEAAAAAAAAREPVDPATSPLVQELLRRTEEKREERVKERLDDYNKRNFKDYFDVVDKGYNGRQMTENDEAIRAQLKKWNGKE